MTAKDALAQLKALGDEKLRAQMMKRGAPENQFGVTRSARRAWSLALVVAALLLPGAVSASGEDAKKEDIVVSSQQLDEALAGKLTYQFVVVGPNELADQDGRRFSPKEAKAYLKRVKPEKKAAYIFWAANKDEAEVAKKVIEVFNDYGAEFFAIRKPKPPGEQTAASEAPAKEGQKKTLMLVGKDNPKALTSADRAPDMSGRPEGLRPERLPKGVRYQFRSDAEVIAAAERTAKLLLDPTAPIEPSAFDKSALALVGVWRHVKHDPAVAEGGKPMISQMEIDGQLMRVEGRVLNSAEQFNAVIKRLREMLAAEGGGTVRALRAKEMSHWWVFIGWDIEEPIFVVESRGGLYRFIVGWSGENVFCLDELLALPLQPKK